MTRPLRATVTAPLGGGIRGIRHRCSGRPGSRDPGPERGAPTGNRPPPRPTPADASQCRPIPLGPNDARVTPPGRSTVT